MYLFALIDTSKASPEVFFSAMVSDIEAFWKLVQAEGEKALQTEKVSSSFKNWMDLYIDFMDNYWHEQKETPSLTELHATYLETGNADIWQFFEDQIDDTEATVDLIQINMSQLFGLAAYGQIVWTTPATDQKEFLAQLEVHVRELTQDLLQDDLIEPSDFLQRLIRDYEPDMDQDVDRVIREVMGSIQDDHDINIVQL